MDLPGHKVYKPRMLAGEELVDLGITKFRIFRPESGVKYVTADGSQFEQQQVQSSLEARKQLLEVERIEKHASLSHANWNEKLMLAEVTKMAGGHWQFMGHHIEKKLYVTPEEALFLMETNALLLTNNEVPVSLQQAYSLLLRTKESETAYKAYATLSRAGYKVFRHNPDINAETNSSNTVNEIKNEKDQSHQTETIGQNKEIKADIEGNTENIGVIDDMKNNTCANHEVKDGCDKNPVSLKVEPNTGCDELHVSNDTKDIDMVQAESTCKAFTGDNVIQTANTGSDELHVSNDIKYIDMVQAESTCKTSTEDAVIQTKNTGSDELRVSNDTKENNMVQTESTCKVIQTANTGSDELHVSNDTKDNNMVQAESTYKASTGDVVIQTANTGSDELHVSNDTKDIDMVQAESTCKSSSGNVDTENTNTESDLRISKDTKDIDMVQAESTCKSSGDVVIETANIGSDELNVPLPNDNEDIDMVQEDCKTSEANAGNAIIAKVDGITKLDLLKARKLKPSDSKEVEKNFQTFIDRELLKENQTVTFCAPRDNCIPQNIQLNKAEYELNEECLKSENKYKAVNKTIIDVDEIDDNKPVVQGDVRDVRYRRKCPQFQNRHDFVRQVTCRDSMEQLRRQFLLPQSGNVKSNLSNHSIKQMQQEAYNRALQQVLNNSIQQQFFNSSVQQQLFNRSMQQHAFVRTMQQQISQSMQQQATNRSMQQHAFNSFMRQQVYNSPMLQQASYDPIQQRAFNSAMPFNRPPLLPNPTHQIIYSEDANVSSTTNEPINRSTQSSRKRKFHIQSIANLVTKLKYINKSGGVPIIKRTSLDRVVSTYNMRYNTNLVLTKDLDLYNGEDIIDVIDSDEEDVSIKRKREDSTNAEFTHELNQIEKLAEVIRELVANDNDTSELSDKISQLIKRFNGNYNTSVSVGNDFFIFHNPITIDSSSESDCDEDEPITQNKTLKNPINILKQLSENANNTSDNSPNVTAGVSNATNSSNYEISKTNTASKTETNTKEVEIVNYGKWLQEENTFGKPELSFPPHQAMDEYVLEFHKNHPCEYGNWLEMKICILELIKAAERPEISDTKPILEQKDRSEGPSIIDKLSIIKSCTDASAETSLKINFDVYERDVKNFKKTCPPKPHFRITCISETSHLPSGSDVAALNASYKDGVVNIFAVVGIASLSVLQIKPSPNYTL